MAPILDRADPTRASPPRPRVIELVGLPGAGKSRLARGIAERLRDRGTPPATRADLGTRARGRSRFLMDAAGHHLRHPGALLAAIQLATGTRPWSASRLRHAVEAADWPRRCRRAGIDGHALVLLDQGCVQDAWSASLDSSARRLRGAERLLGKGLGVGDLRYAFVYCTVPVELAVERIRGRSESSSRFQGMSAERAAAVLSAEAGGLERLLDVAVGRTGAPLLVVDGRRAIDAKIDSVLEFIDESAFG